MRKGFERLYGLVRDTLGQDPLSGHVFLFTNRSGDQTRFRIPIGLCCCRIPLASALQKTRSADAKDRARGECSRSR